VLVGAVVVADQVDLEVLGDLGVDLGQELLELGCPVTPVQAGDHGVGCGVEGGEQGGGAVADVVVSASLWHPGHHRERRLGALQGLDLRFLVHAEHDCSLGGVEVEPDDVVELVDEQRVVGELEVINSVGLELELLPDLPDRRLRQTGPLRHLRATPVRRVRRCRLQGRDDHVLDLVHADRGRPSGALLVAEPVEAMLDEPGPPLADRDSRAAQLLGHRLVVVALGAREHDLRAKRQRL